MSDFRYQQGLPLEWADMNFNLSLIQSKYLDAANSAALAMAAASFKGSWSALAGALNIPASVAHSGKLWILLQNVASVAAHQPGVSASWLEFSLGATNITSINDGPIAGFRNHFVNGGFTVWQRGTTFSGVAGYYTADRWRAPGAAGQVVTRVADHPTLGAGGFCAEVTNTSGSQYLEQRVESLNAANLVGKTVTVSVKMKRMSGSVGGFLGVYYANSKDNFSSQTLISQSNFSLSATWVTYSATFTIPGQGENGICVRLGTSQSGAAVVRVTEAQIEIGASASQFEYRSYGSELALCQRYYFRTLAAAGSPPIGPGVCISTTQSLNVLTLPVTMRVAPTSLEQTGTAADYHIRHSEITACSSVPAIATSSTNLVQITATVASGLTAGSGALLRTATAAGFIGISAEL